VETLKANDQKEDREIQVPDRQVRADKGKVSVKEGKNEDQGDIVNLTASLIRKRFHTNIAEQGSGERHDICSHDG
jgi:hypothetical protein